MLLTHPAGITRPLHRGETQRFEIGSAPAWLSYTRVGNKVKFNQAARSLPLLLLDDTLGAIVVAWIGWCSRRDRRGRWERP
jgi:hypothetical protein